MKNLLIFCSITLIFACQSKESELKIVGWGDSMLNGLGGEKSIIEIAGENFQKPYENLAVGGLKSENIALLQGGIPLKLRAENNTINASGTTSIKIIGPEPINFQTKQQREGRINNTKGTLIRLSDNENMRRTLGYEFKAKGLDLNLKVNDTLIFTFNDAEIHNNGWTIFWAGRNDPKAGDAVYNTRDNIKAMIDNLGPDVGAHYLVLSICNGIADNEGRGSTAHTNITRLNAVLEEAFPDHFIDVRNYMVKQAIYDMGITPTQQDKDDMSKDCIPRRFLKDNIHFNTQGHQAAGKYLTETITARGWTH